MFDATGSRLKMELTNNLNAAFERAGSKDGFVEEMSGLDFDKVFLLHFPDFFAR